MMFKHFDAAKDIDAAFRRLVVEHEAPAIIIADFLERKKEGEEEDFQQLS